jgi:hypothetical protein
MDNSVRILHLSIMLFVAGHQTFGLPLAQAETKQMKLSHEQTLKWINDHRAWRLARKAKPIWARPIDQSEIGKEFQTADHVKEIAKEGYWLCVGVADEPWFQRPERVEAKYTAAGDDNKKFAFDSQARKYRLFKPKEDLRNWAARVDGPDIEGFMIRPNYDVEHPLYSPSGGYVVKDYVADPYNDKPNDVWLVQKQLFELTYEFLPDEKAKTPK